MPREVETQQDRFGQSPHVMRFQDLDDYPSDDHAYHIDPFSNWDPYDRGGQVVDEDGRRTPVRSWNPDAGYEPTEAEERAHELAADDEDSGYNWGPPPDEYQDPGMREH